MLTDDQAREFLRIGREKLRFERLPATVEHGDVLTEAFLRASRAPCFDPEISRFSAWVQMFVARATGDCRADERGRRKLLLLDEEKHCRRGSVQRWEAMNAILAAESPCPLTPRQRDVLQAMADCATTGEAASRLGISTKMAHLHLGDAYKRLGVNALHLALHEAARIRAIRIGGLRPTD